MLGNATEIVDDDVSAGMNDALWPAVGDVHVTLSKAENAATSPKSAGHFIR